MMTKTEYHPIAYFISPHGYGHAARAAGVMEAMCKLDPEIGFEIFTRVPKWFFDDSLSGNFGYHSLLTDIGLAQKTPLNVDLPETVRRLNHFLPLDPSKIRHLAKVVKRLGCQLILCDIAPMGILVAKELGIPSVLIENFTWDWIYQGYLKYDGRIGEHINYLKGLFHMADFHLQTEPVCSRHTVDLTTLPVSRKLRRPAYEIRKKLRIPESGKVVIITMGGIREQYAFLKQLTSEPDYLFVIPGASKRVEIRDNLVLLPHHSDYFHPDLLNAGDAVIGKVGYSTLAEIFYAGVPFGYIARRRFRESRILVSYIEDKMNGLPIAENHFHNGAWLPTLSDLLAFPRIRRNGPRGAEQVARFVYDLIHPVHAP